MAANMFPDDIPVHWILEYGEKVARWRDKPFLSCFAADGGVMSTGDPICKHGIYAVTCHSCCSPPLSLDSLRRGVSELTGLWTNQYQNDPARMDWPVNTTGTLTTTPGSTAPRRTPLSEYSVREIDEYLKQIRGCVVTIETFDRLSAIAKEHEKCAKTRHDKATPDYSDWYNPDVD